MSEGIKNKNEEEFRSEQSEKVVEFLDRSGAYDYFHDIREGKESIPDFEKFKDFIIRINGIARDLPIFERKFDGVDVGLSSRFLGDVIVPKHEDKEGLLKYAYDSIPEVDKKDIKYMLPAVINAVHLFNDGNGRTSRITHLLLGGYTSKDEFLEEAKKALSIDGRFDSLDINPGLIGYELEREVLKKYGWVFDEENPGGRLGPIQTTFGHDVRKFNEQKPVESLAKIFFGLEDSMYELTAVHMLLGSKGIESLLKNYGGRVAISKRGMLDGLNATEWQKLIDTVFQLKKEQVDMLVDIFKDPEKHKTKCGDKVQTVRDAFVEDINKRGNFMPG